MLDNKLSKKNMDDTAKKIDQNLIDGQSLENNNATQVLLMKSKMEHINYDLRKDISNLDKKFNGLEQKFDGLEQKFDKKFENIEQKFDKKFENIEQNFKDIGQNFRDIDQKLDSAVRWLFGTILGVGAIIVTAIKYL